MNLTGLIRIRVRFIARKQRSMVRSPLYPSAESWVLNVSSFVMSTHRPSRFAISLTFFGSTSTFFPRPTFR